MKIEIISIGNQFHIRKRRNYFWWSYLSFFSQTSSPEWDYEIEGAHVFSEKRAHEVYAEIIAREERLKRAKSRKIVVVSEINI